MDAKRRNENIPALNIPPYNPDAERAVLGACLIEPDAAAFAMEKLTAEDFYDPNHRKTFEVMASMASRNVAIDALTLHEELKKQNLDERLGGLSYVTALTEAVTTTANIGYHIDIVRDKAIHRALISVGGDIAKLGYSEETEVNDALDAAERKVFEIARTGRASNIKSIREALLSAMENIETRLRDGVEITGVRTGFKDFDKMSLGLQPGSLYILAARPSMGKTTLAMNIAQYAALREKIPVLVFSLEMSSEQIAQRMLASEAKVNIGAIYGVKQKFDQWTKLQDAAASLETSSIYIDDSSPLNIIELRGKCRRFFAKHGKDAAQCPGLVVVDYLQIMEAGTARKDTNRVQEISDISRTLKSIAREFKVPVLALSQLSRGVEKRDSKKPQLSDLRESGAIEQDADMVAFIYREAYYAQENDEKDATAELIIAKNRNGPTGKVDLVFFREYSRFENVYGGSY